MVGGARRFEGLPDVTGPRGVGGFAARMRPMPGRRRRRQPPVRGAVAAAVVAVATALLAAAVGTPVRAWTPKTQVVIATEAARLAPPDLYRQIDRHRKRFQDGVMAPFEDADPNRHFKDPDGPGSLDRVIVAETERAIRAIVGLHPFEDVVFQLGVVAHYVADAENPLNTSDADPAEGRYFADYAQYLERAEPRLPVIFYGLRPGFDAQVDPSSLVADILSRSRSLYPLIGREYRRIGFASGTRPLRRPLDRLRGGLDQLRPRGLRRRR